MYSIFMNVPKGLKVAKARNGMGIFATSPFPISTRLFAVTGTRVTCELDEDISEVDRDNTFRYSLQWYINPGRSIGAMLNHSCNPNAALRKIGTSLYIVSARSIAAGEEIAIDYSTMIASDDIWEMRCKCGETMCRKKIGNVKTIPKKLRAVYQRRKMIPAYIQ